MHSFFSVNAWCGRSSGSALSVSLTPRGSREMKPRAWAWAWAWVLVLLLLVVVLVLVLGWELGKPGPPLPRARGAEK